MPVAEKKFFCVNCGTQSDERLSWCPVCWNEGSFLPAISRPGFHKVVHESAQIFSAKDLMADGKQRIKAGGAWDIIFEEGIGRPYFIVLYGQPGAGKTVLSLLLANQWPHKTLFVSLEEGLQFTIREKIAWLSIDNVDFCVPSGEADFFDKIQGYDLVVVDSAQKINIDASPLRDMVNDDNRNLILICQITSEGKARGGPHVIHEGDVELHLPSFGRYELKKNRFGHTREGVWRENELANDLP